MVGRRVGGEKLFNGQIFFLSNFRSKSVNQKSSKTIFGGQVCPSPWFSSITAMTTLTFPHSIMGSGFAWMGQESLRVCPSLPTTLVSPCCLPKLDVGGPENVKATHITYICKLRAAYTITNKGPCFEYARIFWGFEVVGPLCPPSPLHWTK